MNKNTIKVETEDEIEISKIVIEHGISATTINRNTDQFIFDNKEGYSTIFSNSKSKKIINEYGENDFLITYNDSLYFEFRQFKTNWHNQHSYTFNFIKENESYFVEIKIKGENDLNLKSQMHPINQAYKYNDNKLRKNYFSNTRKCFENIDKYELDLNEFETKNGKIIRNSLNKSIYVLTCDYDGHLYLRPIKMKLDFESIKQDGQFWVDKNHVYGNYDTSDGEMIYRIKEADVRTFETFGNSIYAKDKNHIYDTRHGKLENVDKRTFTPIYKKGESSTAFGKDKSHFYFWDEIIEDSIVIKQYFKNE